VATREAFLFFAQIRVVSAGELSRGLFRYLPPATSAEFLLGAALIVLSLLGAGWAFQRRADALALERDSIIVEGKVVKLWITHGKGVHFRVTYQYPESGDLATLMFQGEDALPEREFHQLDVGGPLAVKVCPADPANHLIHGARPRPFSNPAGFPIALAVLVAMALAGIINLGWWWACRRCRASGFRS